VELREAIGTRRMVRSFSTRALDPPVLDVLLDDALRAPSAGNTRGVAWLVLEGPAQTATFWECTTDPAWRATSARWPGLSRAPVVCLALSSPRPYLDRYSEADKPPGLGHGWAGGAGESAWPIPYWFGDAAFSAMTLLLGAVDAGLGACFLGTFRGEDRLRAALAVPEDWRVFGSVLLGYPDDQDHRSASLRRAATPRAAAVHRGHWSAPA
jgi:nitroreductase